MIEEYVAGLGRALHGPRGVRAGMLAEVRDSLTDAAEAYAATGLAPAEAERRAVADFGPLPEVADGLQAELRARQGRLTAVVLAAAVLLQWVGAELHWRSAYTAALPDAPPADAGYAYLARVTDLAHVLVVGLALAAFLAIRRGDRARSDRVVRAIGGFGLGVLAVNLGAGLLLTAFAPIDPASVTPTQPLSVLGGVLLVVAVGAGAFSALRCLRVARHTPAATVG